MEQRVNIQYSVELGELQAEVNRLFGNAIAELEKLQPVGGSPVVKLGTDGLEKLDLLRRKLTKVDIMLGDVQNIVEGYVRFKTGPEPIPADTSQRAIHSEADQIEQQIKDFKEFFIANSNKEPEDAN